MAHKTSEAETPEAPNSKGLNHDNIWCEWFMGWPLHWTGRKCDEEDVVRWVTDTIGGAWWHYDQDLPKVVNKTERHRISILGNGQVPIVAAMAVHLLTKKVV